MSRFQYSFLVLLALLATRSEATNNSVWSDVELVLEQLGSNHRNLQQQEGLFCRAAIDILDGLAPSNQNRVCSCNIWTGGLQCKYQSVTCGDQIVPSLEFELDLGLLRSSKLKICQHFAETYFEEPVCMDTNLDGMKYGSCNQATMGDSTQCACTVCEGGTTLDIDCSEKHPLAKTNGCQRVFFQDSCLDFMSEEDLFVEEQSESETIETVEAVVLELVEDDNSTSYNPEDVDDEDFDMDNSATIQVEEEEENDNLPVEVDTEWEPDAILQQILSTTLIGLHGIISARIQRNFNQRISSDGTPSQRASDWLRADPNYDTYDSTKLIQRFALASLYYSTTAYETEWDRSDDWLSTSVDECDWYSVSDDICTSSGQLEMIDLSENNLYGTIPPDIGFLRTVKYLYLNGNYLTGTIPTEVGKLTDLIDFDLHESEINGTIPTEIGRLVHLEALSLNENDLSGTIPSELGLLTNVFAIELQQNLLSGTVPAEVCDLIANHGVELYLDCDEYGVECSQECGCMCI